MTYGINWSTPMVYYLVEILSLSFCLLDSDIGNPCPVVSPPPVQPLMLGFTSYDTSMYHLGITLFSELMIRFRYLVPLIYFKIFTIFNQSLWCGYPTLYVRQHMALPLSGFAIFLVNNIFATSLWKISDFSLLIFSQSSSNKTGSEELHLIYLHCLLILPFQSIQ